MSGHSKWATIKRKKGAIDAKKGAVFTKLVKEITTAARMGGGDPAGNPRLRLAIDKAKAQSMPNDNINRAIKKGTGELEGVTYEEITFEGYGPGGVAIMVETLTDNRNRTSAEVRHAFTKYNGNLGTSGSVARLFEKKGRISVEKDGVDEDTVMMAALDAGAEDVRDDGDYWEVITAPSDFDQVLEAVKKAGLEPDEAEVTRLPLTTVEVSGKDAENVMRIYEILEENDDVQNVYANFDISDEEMERIQA